MKRMLWAAVFCAVILAGCAKVSSELELRQENVCTLSDGTQVSQWEHKVNDDSFRYILPDKHTLLRVDILDGREEFASYFSALCSGWDEVDEGVRDAILDYYVQRGTLTAPGGTCWDLVQGRMEEVYGAYQKDKKTDAAYVTEMVTPVMQNGRLLVFCSEVTTTRNADGYFEMPAEFAGAPNSLNDALSRTTEIFDRGTGERIPVEELFSVEPEEASARLAELCAQQGAGYLGASVPLERVVPENECLRVWFTAEENGFIVNSSLELDYGSVTDILQPWAVPEASAAELV